MKSTKPIKLDNIELKLKLKNLQPVRFGKPTLLSPIKFVKNTNRPVSCMSVGAELN